MASIGDINLQEPSTVTKRLAAVAIDRNSTTQYQEVMVLGSPNSTGVVALAEVQATVPASTSFGLVVRVADPSTGPIQISSVGGVVAVSTGPVQVSSVGGVVQVSTGPFQISSIVGVVTVSTGPFAISSIAGVTRTMPNSTAWASSAGFHFDSSGAMQVTGLTATVSPNSSAADYIPVRISNGSTFLSPAVDYTHGSTLSASTVAGPTVLLRASSTTPAAVSTSDMFVTQWGTLNGAAVHAMATSSGAFINAEASQPSTSAIGLVVRPVIGGIQNYAASTTGNSTATTIVSSNAASKAYVFSMTITSTVTALVNGGVYDGANSGGTLKYPFVISSGYGGLTLTVSPPAYLFSGSTGSALTFVTNSSNGGMNVAISYWIST